MKQPLASIIVTDYNYGKYIGDAISSAVAQKYENTEIIIINDGSTDNSEDIIKEFVNKFPQIRYYAQENKGVAPTRNRGLSLARGEYVVFLDADNIFPTNYVDVLVRAAMKNELDVAYTDIQQFGKKSELIVSPDFDIEKLKAKNIIDMAALIRKSAIGDQKFDDNLNELSHEDWDFFLGLALKGAKIGKIKGTFLKYRMHGKSHNALSGGGYSGTEAVRFVKMYFYVIEKYKRLHPGEIDFSTDSDMVLWYKQYKESGRIIKYNEWLIASKEAEIDALKKSHAYKIGQMIVAPIHWLRKIAKVA